MSKESEVIVWRRHSLEPVPNCGPHGEGVTVTVYIGLVHVAQPSQKLNFLSRARGLGRIPILIRNFVDSMLVCSCVEWVLSVGSLTSLD